MIINKTFLAIAIGSTVAAPAALAQSSVQIELGGGDPAQ